VEKVHALPMLGGGIQHRTGSKFRVIPVVIEGPQELWTAPSPWRDDSVIVLGTKKSPRRGLAGAADSGFESGLPTAMVPRRC